MNMAFVKTTFKTLLLLSVMGVSLILLVACGGGGDGLGGTGITPIAKGKLTRSNETKLSAYFQESIKNSRDDSPSAPIITDDNASEDGAGGDVLSSSTNVQEAGVDEADLIKNNGRYIYSVEKVSSDSIFIDTGGIDGGASVGVLPQETEQQSDAIRIMDTQGVSGLVEIKRFTSDEQANEEPWSIAGLYLHEAEKRLIALTSPKHNYYTNWFDSQYFSNQETKILFLDVNDPENALRKSTLQFEGQLISSRRNGDTLYMVLRHFPDYQYVDDERLLTTTTNDFLPAYRIDNGAKRLIAKPQDCYLEVGQKGSTDIITLVAVDLKSATPQVNSQCYVGSAEAIYASQNALYLATTRWDYQASNGIAVYNSKVTTDIHKFDYDSLDFDYRGSGEVDGHLGFKQDSKSFRFSESQGLLRVVTFDEDQWVTIGLPEVQPVDDGATTANEEDAASPPVRAKSPVSLSILEENPTKKALQLVSKLPNAERPEPIGLPGEQLYATRFIGNRAYVVTFRVTDPLYVLDLSNPADPFIAGELKVNGYSDYLHPITENLLLGVGKDAIPAGNGGDGRGAWYQGVKLSLIDVSDPSNPREADKVILGKRGTETNVLYDHHALTSLKVDNEYRVAIPVKLHNKEPSFGGSNPASTYYNYTHTGLYRFEIDINNQTIDKIPAIVVADASDRTSQQVPINNDRSVIIDDTVYYMHDGKFWIQDWQGEDELVGPE